jgi:hypothetical protein
VDVASGSNAQVMAGLVESFNKESAKYLNDLSEEELMELIELNLLLDELGLLPFKDWTCCEPLPVDADQLPAVVPRYKTSFKLLPYEVNSCLSNKSDWCVELLEKRLCTPLVCQKLSSYIHVFIFFFPKDLILFT